LTVESTILTNFIKNNGGGNNVNPFHFRAPPGLGAEQPGARPG